MRIRDAAIRTFTENLKKTSTPKLTDANVLELLPPSVTTRKPRGRRCFQS